MSEAFQQNWSEIEPAAAKMFNVWTHGSELSWAKEAWGHLYAAGLAGQSNVLESTASLLRLVTLALIYQEFSGLAWDENPDRPAAELAEDLDIDLVALGILAAASGCDEFDEVEDDYDLREAAILAVTRIQRPEIFQCLKAAFGGEIPLYQRLSRTNSINEESDGEEFDPTFSNCAAFQYVTNGLQS